MLHAWHALRERATLGTAVARGALMLVAWFLLIGALLISMAFVGHWVARSPLSPALLYMALGAALAAGTPMLPIDAVSDARWIEALAEVAVLISLFAVGLKLRVPIEATFWRPALRLAVVAMVAAIALGAALGYALLGLSVGAAILLASIVAPTDPVLASEVQIRRTGERDALRVTLSAEGGLNDGMAFPGVMLGLGLIGAHDLGPHAARWVSVDVVWAIAGGGAIGWLLAVVLARLLALMRARGILAAFEEFFVLGGIALVYGAALSLHTYGFLAVFAAGLTLRQRERVGGRKPAHDPVAGVTPALAARFQHFTEQLERLAEVAVVLVVGALLVASAPALLSYAFAAMILLVVRPLSVLIGLLGVPSLHGQRRYIAWFGIRGIGSVYYLAFALNHGLAGAVGGTVVEATLATIALSIFAHGVSATPLMRRREESRGPSARAES
jgi:sodium/hydrogen antiporter